MVKGGVLIAHQIHEGKHQYEVENVVKYKTDVGGNFFVRYNFNRFFAFSFFLPYNSEIANTVLLELE